MNEEMMQDMRMRGVLVNESIYIAGWLRRAFDERWLTSWGVGDEISYHDPRGASIIRAISQHCVVLMCICVSPCGSSFEVSRYQRYIN